MSKYIAYVETLSGVYREEDGIMYGPFTREDLGFTDNQYIPKCQILSVREPVSISFGFGYGVKSDNTFEVKTIARKVREDKEKKEAIDSANLDLFAF